MTLALDLTAPLPAHWLLVFLVQVTVLLLGARVLGGLAVRLGLPALAGELLAGVLLGPSVLGAGRSTFSTPSASSAYCCSSVWRECT